MPHNHEWQTRIKAVEREYLAIRSATDQYKQAAHSNPILVPAMLSHRDIVAASDHLEGTYLIRLFAEFETGARQFWTTHWDTHPRTIDLLDALAARCRIPDMYSSNSHLVRVYRNSLVHEREQAAEAVPIAIARAHLCRYFSFLPHRW